MFERHYFRYDSYERPCAFCEEFWRLLSIRGNFETVGWMDNKRRHEQFFGTLVCICQLTRQRVLELEYFSTTCKFGVGREPLFVLTG